MHSAIVIISGTVTYFYNQAGRRVVEALRNLGWSVDLRTLKSPPEREYDWGFLMNTTDLVASCTDMEDAFQRLELVRRHCRHLAVVLLEAVESNWFTHAVTLSRQAGVDVVLDGGLYNQIAQVTPAFRPMYRFFFNGLTASERCEVDVTSNSIRTRPIPWAFVGQLTPDRANLVHRLVVDFDPAGFVYLARPEPVRDQGPHLNEEKFLTVLKHSRYQIWCSQHTWFYQEGERFRMSLLTGSVPIKVVLDRNLPNQILPFHYLMVDWAECLDYLRSCDIETTQQRFIKDFLALPSLEESLSEAVSEMWSNINPR